jgi:Flp pilus assembly protein TadG
MTVTTKPRGATAFFRHRGGSAATILAVSMLPIVALTGAALDYSRASEAQSALQKVTDSAALAAAIAGRDGAKSPEKVALDVVAGQVNAPNAPIRDVKARYSASQGNHTVATSATVDASLLKSLGWKGIDISSSATAAVSTANAEPTEVVFVFDVSASMSWGSRWSDAVAAVKNLLEELKGAQSRDFYATLVPMSDRINVSSVGSSVASWMKSPPPAGWTGCLEPREIAEPGFPFAMTDAPPTGSSPFVASTAGNYIPHNPIPGRWPWTPVCPGSRIEGPTSDVNAIVTALNALKPVGTGRLDEGMVWAWRLLSVKWKGQWKPGGEYPGRSRRKVVVYLTDGNTEAYAYEVGGVDGKTFGWNLGSVWGFSHLVEMCSKMTKQGIEIYMFQLPGNDNFDSYAKACASKPDNYAKISNVDTLKLALARVSTGEEAGVRLVK